MATTPSLGTFKLTASPDFPDLRDWSYEPPLIQLRRSIARPRSPRVLQQGDEGSCTGFGLTAVINLLSARSGRRQTVSPRMLYEMARKFDEWRGEKYEGSSCRGAIKGWHNMGVCSARDWPYRVGQPGKLTVQRAKKARSTTIGAYYRLQHRISDFHAALNEAGAIYCSAQVHDGWDDDAIENGVISFESGQEQLGGHAFAIVGYTSKGFWVQNSWGRSWARNGLALWLYEDWHANICDAWVVRLALPTPQIWHLPPSKYTRPVDEPRLSRRTPARAEIAGHFVHIDDGDFHDNGRYWSNLVDVVETADLLAQSDKYDHLLFYAHGGLNSTKDSARRIAAMKEIFKANRVYPYHFMYDTGLLEEIRDVIAGKSNVLDERIGAVSDWSDRLIERIARVPGRALWREMKHGARLPFSQGHAGAQTLHAFFDRFWQIGGTRLKIHLAGHSTGGILLAYLIESLEMMESKSRISSLSLMAPAATIGLFESHYRPYLLTARSRFGLDRMHVYCLTDMLERDDDVATLYRKSLLYLVSNSLEERQDTPLLGLQKHNKALADGDLRRLSIFYSDGDSSGRARSASENHAGFDNDPQTMNSILRTILGRRPDPEFTAENLSY